MRGRGESREGKNKGIEVAGARIAATRCNKRAGVNIAGREKICHEELMGKEQENTPIKEPHGRVSGRDSYKGKPIGEGSLMRVREEVLVLARMSSAGNHVEECLVTMQI